jgi:hypothetical protein
MAGVGSGAPIAAPEELHRQRYPGRNKPMHDMMMGGGMMWGMGVAGLLIILVVILGIAALVKYLFFD